jgi:hypothetical protein
MLLEGRGRRKDTWDRTRKESAAMNLFAGTSSDVPGKARPPRKGQVPAGNPVRGPNAGKVEGGLQLGLGLVFEPRKMESERTHVFLVGVLKNQGRSTPSVAQFIRLGKNGQITLYGRLRELAPRQELKVVIECQESDRWVGRLLSRAEARALFNKMARVAEVPAEFKGRLSKD